jgi:hypothetical protein
MQDRLFRKCLIIGIIILFIGASVVQGISINNKKVSESKKIDSLNTEYLMINTTSVNMLNEKGDLNYNPKDEYIDQQQTQHGSSGLDINYDQFVAQSFKPSVQRLSKVHLKLFKYGGTPNYELEFSVRKTLNGNDLVLVTKTGTQVTNGWNEFDFPDLQVQVDNTYYLVCVGDAGTGGDPYYCWYYSDTNPYNRGMLHIFNYGDWHNVPSADCCFKTIYTNDPPNPPSNPYPSDGETNVDINAYLSWTGSDPDPDDTLIYDVYFEADDTTPDVLVSNNQIETTYNPGQMEKGVTYYWKIIAEDECGEKTSSPVWHFTTAQWENEPPDKPVITGKTSGKVGVSYIYSAVSTDPDGDQIWYWFDWGDNTNTGWTGPYNSGIIAYESHTWNAPGTYHIKVKAKDIYDLESLWATLDVSMPRSKINIINNFFLLWRLFNI